MLDVPGLEPARPEEEHNHYVFEKSVTFRHNDGTTTNGRFRQLHNHTLCDCEHDTKLEKGCSAWNGP